MYGSLVWMSNSRHEPIANELPIEKLIRQPIDSALSDLTILSPHVEQRLRANTAIVKHLYGRALLSRESSGAQETKVILELFAGYCPCLAIILLPAESGKAIKIATIATEDWSHRSIGWNELVYGMATRQSLVAMARVELTTKHYDCATIWIH